MKTQSIKWQKKTHVSALTEPFQVYAFSTYSVLKPERKSCRTCLYFHFVSSSKFNREEAPATSECANVILALFVMERSLIVLGMIYFLNTRIHAEEVGSATALWKTDCNAVDILKYSFGTAFLYFPRIPF